MTENMTRFQILKDDATIDPHGIVRNIFERLEKLEQQMGDHLNSLSGVEFKAHTVLLSEQLNQIVQPHREQNPLPVDRMAILEDFE